MRDAVGGTFMMYVLLVFLAVYITFVAVAFNYARAFRVKNKVIDIIEQNEGLDDYRNTSGAIGDIENYLNSVSYNVNSNGNSVTSNNCPGYVDNSDDHYFNNSISFISYYLIFSRRKWLCWFNNNYCNCSV